MATIRLNNGELNTGHFMVLTLDKWKLPDRENREKLYKLLLYKLYGVPLSGWESFWHVKLKNSG